MDRSDLKVGMKFEILAGRHEVLEITAIGKDHILAIDQDGYESYYTSNSILCDYQLLEEPKKLYAYEFESGKVEFSTHSQTPKTIKAWGGTRKPEYDLEIK